MSTILPAPEDCPACGQSLRPAKWVGDKNLIMFGVCDQCDDPGWAYIGTAGICDACHRMWWQGVTACCDTLQVSSMEKEAA